MQFLELCSFNLPQFFNKFYNDPCLKALKDAGLKKEDVIKDSFDWLKKQIR